jgi:signal transduction histidine kinase
MLERRYRDQISDPKALELLDSMILDARRIRALVLDLLAFTEISVPELIAVDLVDTGELLREAANKLRLDIEETGATLAFSDLPSVRAVKAHLAQLFEHLISNSLKYRSGDPPRITVSASRERDFWLFRFQDNGIGIAPEYQLRIFGLFKRLHGREIPGTGMGLAICQKIIERNGGEMWVESEPGRGSTFCFTLPA